VKLDALTILAAGEPSKAPFYVFGALLAAWAVVLAAIGLSQADFPGSPARARVVMAISATLVLATTASAVATSSKHEPEESEEAAEQPGEKAGPPGKALQISADPSGQLRFDKTTLTAKAGKVTVEFDNPSQIAHDFTVRDAQGELGGTKVITSSKVKATIPLEKGTYTFFCSVDGHRQAGMQGKLTVT